MEKFIVLYRSPYSAEEQMSGGDPEQMKAGMEAWMVWAKGAGEAIVDLGTPLGRGRHLDGSRVAASDTDLAGYSILQAESLDEVVRLLAGHPHLGVPENTVDVLPMLNMPGM